MAWLILILAVPYLGLVAFLLFGSTSVGRHRSAVQARVNAAVVEAAGPALTDPGAERPDRVEGLARLNRRLAALPMVGGNTVEVLPDYEESIAQMTAAVSGARTFVHVEFYILMWDEMTNPFFEALVAAADRGVEVRVLFDHLGTKRVPGYKTMLQRLESSRVRWAPMLPVGLRRGGLRRPDLRNHRKILVVDGEIGFVGSQNMIEPGYDSPRNHKRGLLWRELVAEVTGPVVQQLTVVFATDWLTETGENVQHTLVQVSSEAIHPRDDGIEGVACQVVPSGPGFTTENNLRLFNTMLYSAARRISITSPYFVPDETLLYAVTTAAQRGVEVELFVSAVADQFMVAHAQRSYYQGLLDAGVRIWLYPEPYVLHRRRRPGRHRLLQHGLPVVRAELRGRGPGRRVHRRRPGGRGAGCLPRGLDRADRSGVG
jgi:cardiolipin synthase